MARASDDLKGRFASPNSFGNKFSGETREGSGVVKEMETSLDFQLASFDAMNKDTS
jgi:hypothetical protein